MKKILALTIPVILGFIVGLTARYFQSATIDTWYLTLNMSQLTPPNNVFPIAWGIIYLCSGLSMGIIWNTGSIARLPMAVLFAGQLFLNFMWSFGFFYLMSPLSGFVTIILLDAVVLFYTSRARHISNVATWLFAPYIAWLALATYLNGYILVFN